MSVRQEVQTAVFDPRHYKSREVLATLTMKWFIVFAVFFIWLAEGAKLQDIKDGKSPGKRSKKTEDLSSEELEESYKKFSFDFTNLMENLTGVIQDKTAEDVVARFQNEGEDDQALSFSSIEVASFCLAGSTMGSKFDTAVSDCSEVTNNAKQIKGCPSFTQFMNALEDFYAVPQCVMKSMGWIDNDGVMVEAVRTADIDSLNPSLTDLIGKNSYCSFIPKYMRKFIWFLKKSGCKEDPAKIVSGYDRVEYQDFLGKIYFSECKRKDFMRSCKAYLKGILDGIHDSEEK